VRPVRILTASGARIDPFDCERWSKLAANASREEVANEGYVHDVYEATFAGPFERAAELLLQYKIFAPHRMFSHV
jgi:hypothetical protein